MCELRSTTFSSTLDQPYGFDLLFKHIEPIKKCCAMLDIGTVGQEMFADMIFSRIAKNFNLRV